MFRDCTGLTKMLEIEEVAACGYFNCCSNLLNRKPSFRMFTTFMYIQSHTPKKKKRDIKS